MGRKLLVERVRIGVDTVLCYVILQKIASRKRATSIAVGLERIGSIKRDAVPLVSLDTFFGFFRCVE